jgi:phage terminase large subunit-like protein
LNKDRIEYLKSRTNGVVFDDNCNPLTEIDYPDLYYYDKDAACWAREFMEKTSHVLEDGHNYRRGDTLKLLEWQNQSCCNVYGIKKRSDKLRRYHFEFILIPKKQGKSPYLGMRGPYHLIADGVQRGLIYVVAADKDNAKIIHDNAKQLILIENELGETFLSDRLLIRRNDIYHERSQSRFKVISSEAKTKHGYNLSVIFIDEPHAWPEMEGQELYDTLTKGIMARPEPVVSIISTAGFKNSWFHRTKYDYAKKIIRGHVRDDRWLVFLYEPDVQALIEKYGDDWSDGRSPWWAQPQVWKEVNPSYGVTVKEEYFKGEVTLCRNAPENLSAFLRLHLNVFTGTTVEWTISTKWDHLKTDITFSDLRGEACFAGIYTSKPGDMTSLCLFFPEKNHFHWLYFTPKTVSDMRKNTLSGYGNWVDQGYIKEIDGNYISTDEHLNLMEPILEQVDCRLVTYRTEDPEIAEKLKDKGYEINNTSVIGYEIKKSTQEFQNRVLSRELTHSGNPMTSYQISMTEIQIKEDTIRPHADLSRDNICGVFAGLLALSGWKQNEDQLGDTKNYIIGIDL